MKTIIIKKYPNRKFYRTDVHSYVTLTDIAKLVHQGEQIQVIKASLLDNVKDITVEILTQILFERQRQAINPLTITQLRAILQYRDGVINSITLFKNWDL